VDAIGKVYLDRRAAIAPLERIKEAMVANMWILDRLVSSSYPVARCGDFASHLSLR
jgi:hypothetical protein